MPSSLVRRWAARGFSAAGILNALQPRDGWELYADIAYQPGPRGLLDVYLPAVRSEAPAPLVVFFYGGSWQGGAREIYRFVGASLARKGFVTVIPDYRVYPQARYPDFLADAAQAVYFARDNAGRWHANPRHLVVMGHSAGAYIAAMLTFDKRWLGSVDLDPMRDIAGLAGLAGPYDFLPVVDPILQTIFGGADRIDTQPIRYVTHGAPPALLVAPRKDGVVSPGNTKRLAAHIRGHRSRVKEVHYPKVGHLTLIGAFAPALRFMAPVFADVSAFIRNPAAIR